MKILLTNDDGIKASGFKALRNELNSCHQVFMVAPSNPRSACGMGLSLNRPIKVKEVLENNTVVGLSVDGTPVDCVKLGINLFPHGKPDIVVSGINQGNNFGNNILYSGTVGASLEAAIQGYDSVAVSQKYDGIPPDFKFAAKFTRILLEKLDMFQLPQNSILNVNIPHENPSMIKGIKITRQGQPNFKDFFRKHVEPNRSTYYWLDAEFLDPGDDETQDVAALKENYISISPLSFYFTDNFSYEKLLRLDDELLTDLLEPFS